MAEVTYEGMFLLDSNRYAANPDGTKGEVTAILERVGAKVLATRPWLDGKLSYPIKGHRKGLHFLTYFTADSRQVHEVDRLCKFNESILRHLVIKLHPALVGPMLAMATGRGEVVSSFHETDTPAPATEEAVEVPAV